MIITLLLTQKTQTDDDDGTKPTNNNGVSLGGKKDNLEKLHLKILVGVNKYPFCPSGRYST